MGRGAAMALMIGILAGPGQAAPVTGRVAAAALLSPKGAQAVMIPTRALSDKDAQILRQAAATQKYYGAVAISPDQGLMSDATLAAANYHDVASARTAALAGCDKRRKPGSAACVIVAEILPIGWKEGAAVQLSADATAAFGQLKGRRVMAVDTATGDWGAGTAPQAALAACQAKTGTKSCEIVISD